MRIMKRNGKQVDFDKTRIATAIVLAMRETDIIDSKLAVDIAENISKEIGEYGDQLNVEDIQDLVEKKLMDSDRKDVAKKYVLYREKRKEERVKNSNLTRKIQEIMSLKNIDNSNANVDESSFSGKKYKSVDYMLKQFALDNLITEDVKNAFLNSEIYIHDLSEYAVGSHNCLMIDFEEVFKRGFRTRNGDVRPPKSISTAMQLVAVVFQCQSQVQFGGVGSNKLDYDLAPYVAMSFKKHLEDGLKYVGRLTDSHIEVVMSVKDLNINNKLIANNYKDAYNYAYDMTYRETMQSCQALYHNLNTLESRAGSQVPFTSINFGTDTSTEGRMIIECLLKASIDGIGEHKQTSIFPISIFKHKKGVNDKPGTPNYDMKKLAIESLTKRIYPNFANCDAPHLPIPTNPNEEFCTMGCRTMLGTDRHGLAGHSGRGNISPVTINLVDLGIKHGICKNHLNEEMNSGEFAPDLDGFVNDLHEKLKLTEKALVDRYRWQAAQLAKSAQFMYENGVMKNTLGRDLNEMEPVEECLKHGTLAMGYIGLAEAMKALFGKHHGEDEGVFKFAHDTIVRIHEYAKEASARHDLNFSCYATPAESTCSTLLKGLQKKYGIIEGVTDREFITNSHHIPTYYEMSVHEKIEKEAKFAHLSTGGFISYVELESTVVNNPDAVESIIDYAMEQGSTYLAVNFPIDTCLNCGYAAEITNDDCPICESEKIQRLRRVTGYLTTDYRRFNAGKQAEVLARVKHSKFSKM